MLIFKSLIVTLFFCFLFGSISDIIYSKKISTNFALLFWLSVFLMIYKSFGGGFN